MVGLPCRDIGEGEATQYCVHGGLQQLKGSLASESETKTYVFIKTDFWAKIYSHLTLTLKNSITEVTLM